MNEEVVETPAEAPETPAEATSLFGDASAAPEAVAETPDAPEENGTEKYAGKYNSIDDLEAGYKGQTAYIKELEAKGKEGTTAAPEPTDDNRWGYDYTEAFTNAGINPLDITNEDGTENEEAVAKYDEFFGSLKEAGFNQAQMETMVAQGGDWLQEQMQSFVAEHGPDVDIASEASDLEKVWGDNKDANAQAVAKWAEANISSDLYNKPLHQTAQGMQLLKGLMDGQLGKTPITDKGASSSFDVEAVETEIDRLMHKPEYKDGDIGKHNATQKKVHQLISQLESHK